MWAASSKVRKTSWCEFLTHTYDISHLTAEMIDVSFPHETCFSHCRSVSVCHNKSCFSFSTPCTQLRRPFLHVLVISLHSLWTSLAPSVRQESLFSLPCHSHFGQYATQLYYWPGLDSCQPISGLKGRPNNPDADDYGGGRGMRKCTGNSLTGCECVCV